MVASAVKMPALRAVFALALALGIGFTAGTVRAQATDPVVAKVNGVEIRQSDLAVADEEIGATLPPQITGDAKREYLITYLTDMILLAQDAEMQGMSSTDDFKRRFQMA